MNSEVKTKWITALRSGEYEQGTGALAINAVDDKVQYCCLGVLCDLAVKEGVLDAPVLHPNSGLFEYQVTGNMGQPMYEAAFLPQVVADWAGVTTYGEDPNQAQHEYRSPLDLPEKNDSGMKFDDIANLIDEYM